VVLELPIVKITTSLTEVVSKQKDLFYFMKKTVLLKTAPLSIAFGVIFPFIILSCASNEVSPNEKPSCNETNGTILRYQSACGWSANYDSLSLDGNTLVYKCKLDRDYKQGTINCADQELLWSKINLNEFYKINKKTCHICADGCDYTISIKTNTNYHKITVGDAELEKLPEIKSFVDQLKEIASEIKSDNCQ
jgi:hypothetical protein